MPPALIVTPENFGLHVDLVGMYGWSKCLSDLFLTSSGRWEK